MKNIRIFIIIALFSIFVSSCKDTDEPNPSSCNRTILVYMVATNSLGSSGYDTEDIGEMDEAIASCSSSDCRLLVYYVSYSAMPCLFEIVKVNGSVKHISKKEYSSSIRSTTKARMEEVFADVKAIAPATDYGLVLWSHADGWAKSISLMKVKSKNGIMLCDFGEDRGAKMALDSLADALPSNMFSFIYTDACYMAAIEVAYQLRDKTDFFIGSVTEIPSDGMPYELNIPCFFKSTPDLEGACKNTFNYYNEKTGSNRTATISLIDCSKLDALASICQDIQQTSTITVNSSNIQCYSRSSQHIFYDFYQYYSTLASAQQKAILGAALSQAVTYKACTPMIFSELAIDSDNFSGLSTYILGTGSSTNENYYKTLNWYNDIFTK